jgi:molybdopterin-guanine dinucleotide biosynthesis adapter protein
MTGDRSQPPALFGFIGRSGAGKTSLILEVIAGLRRRGLAVSAIKRGHDGIDLDQPGKDSWRMREAGCSEVIIASDRRFALLHEYRDQPEASPVDLARRMSGVDVVLLEGFRAAPVPMIEVFRPSLGRPALWRDVPQVVAVATDGAVDCPLPVLDLRLPEDVTGFVGRHLGLAGFDRAGDPR